MEKVGELNKITAESEFSQPLEENPFFVNSNPSERCSRLSKDEIIDLLRSKKHIRFTDLRKISRWKQTSLWNLLRDLDYAKFVKCQIITDENNRQQKIIHWIGGQR